jgi:hypothetical protein
MRNGQGKSDSPEVPEKSPNNAGPTAAEGMEGRGLAKGNLPQQNASGHRARKTRPVRWSGYVRQPVRIKSCGAVAAQPERPHDLGYHAALPYSLAASAFCRSSLSPAPPGHRHLRQEPDAVVPLVRIRGGVVSRTRAVERDAVLEMKVGPSKPVCRNRLQTAMSGYGQKPRGGTSWSKGVRKSRHVRNRETNASEPLRKHRNGSTDDIETGASPLLRE